MGMDYCSAKALCHPKDKRVEGCLDKGKRGEMAGEDAGATVKDPNPRLVALGARENKPLQEHVDEAEKDCAEECGGEGSHLEAW